MAGDAQEVQLPPVKKPDARKCSQVWCLGWST